MVVRWGFLGAGWIAARALAPAVHAATGATLHAVAARDSRRAEALGPARVHDSYDALLADADVDAVYISLANDDHAEWARAALEAGKHVLCEKPLALDTDEVSELIAASLASDRMLVEASMWRWHPRTRRLVALLAAGAVGQVRHISAGFTFSADVTGDLRSNYRADPERGGGALYDIGCYGISAVLLAVGSQPLVDVSAHAVMGETGVDLTTEAVLDFGEQSEGASTATIRASFAEPEAQWLVISGDDGELECAAPVFTASSQDVAELIVSDGSHTTRESFDPVDPYRLMVEAFSARITGDESSWVLPLAETRRGAELLDRIRAAVTSAN